MKQTAAFILLCIFISLQYSRQLNYYYCLFSISASTTQCVCTDADDNENNISSPAVPLQKTNKGFWVDEHFADVSKHNTVTVLKLLTNCNRNYFNTGFYNYRYSNSLLKPPRFTG